MNYSDRNHRDIFLKIAKIFIIVQLVVCVIQMNPAVQNALSYIWDMDRLWHFRRIGTFNNPNTLSITTMIIFSFIYFIEKSKRKVIFYFLLTFGIILLSGSRTGLVLLFVLTFVNYCINNGISLKTIAYVGFLGFLLIFLFVFLLNQHGDSFAYLAQTMRMFDAGTVDLEADSAFAARLVIWQGALDFRQEFTVFQKLFGVGPAKETIPYFDNDFLSIYVRNGIIGSIVFISYLLYLLIALIKNIRLAYSKLMISVIFIFLVSAVTGATFTSWYLSLFFFFFLGCFEREKVEYKNIAITNKQLYATSQS